jgi:outer membrane protein
MKKIFCSVVVFAITSLSVQAITLEEALIAAFLNNKEWAANKTDKNAAEARYKQAVLAFLPNVSGTVSATRERDDRHRKVLKLDAGTTNTETTGTNMSLTVSQNIFSGFSTTNTMAAAEHSNNAAFHKLRSEEQTLVLNVVNAYTEIWFCRKRLDALKKMVENLKNTMQAQQSSFEAGMATPTDVAEAESKYQGAIYSMINSETELMTAEADFERLTGKQADDDMSLPDFPFELPKSLKKLMEKAMTSNSSINMTKLQEQAALKNLSAVRGRLSPSCDASLTASRSLSKERTSYLEEDTGRNHYSASVSVTVPIFSNSNGSNTYSQIEIANQEALKARFTAEDTVLKVKRECVVNWNKYKSAIAMIKASRSAVKSAELSSEGNIEETALGMKSNTDVWAKENNLLESRVNLAKSQKERIVAAVTLLFLTGDLSVNSILSNMNIQKKKYNKQKQQIKG